MEDKYVSIESTIQLFQRDYEGKYAITNSDALFSLLIRVPEKYGWRDAETDPPDDAEPVLAYYERNAWHQNGKRFRKKEIGVGWCIDHFWHVDGCSKVVSIAWMPLPKPPGRKRNGEKI